MLDVEDLGDGGLTNRGAVVVIHDRAKVEGCDFYFDHVGL